MSATALTVVDTLGYAVARTEKPLDPKYVTALARFIKRLVDEEFAGSARAAAKEIGISQSHFSQMMKGPEALRGTGLRSVLLVHEYTKVSLDEMLGIDVRAAQDERLARLERRMAELESARHKPVKSTVRPRARGGSE